MPKKTPKNVQTVPQLTQGREVWKETFRHGVVMNVEEGLGTREEKEFHYRRLYGKNMYLENRHLGNLKKIMEEIGEH